MPAAQQKSSNVLDVNSPAPSTLNLLVGYSGNCVFNLSICANIRANAKLRVDSNDSCSHLVDESIITRKYLKGPLGGSIGPQISALICSRNCGIENIVFGIDGRVVSFPCEHAIQAVFTFGLTVFGIPLESLMILLYIVVPGWPSRQCQMYVISSDSCCI